MLNPAYCPVRQQWWIAVESDVLWFKSIEAYSQWLYGLVL
jgi:hypothetical protein